MAVIGSCTCCAMSLSDRRLLLSFRPCWGHRLRPVEDDGAHNAGGARADRWTLPQVHAVSSWASLSKMVLMVVFCLTMARSVGVVLIPTLTVSRKLGATICVKLALLDFCTMF